MIDWHLNIKKSPLKLDYDLLDYFDDSIFDFHRQLEAYLPTPLIELEEISRKYNSSQLLLKDESKRMEIGAFKALGASWAIHSYLQKNPGKHTFCSATDGNHGRSVAWSSKIFNQNAVIFMPTGSVKSRIENIKKEGAQVIIVEGDYDYTVQTALKESIKNNYVLIQDTAWEAYTEIPLRISAGYITIIKELEIQLLHRKQDLPDFIILQSGVGSWASAMILYIVTHFKGKTPKFIIAEPYESDCLLESAKQNKISTTKKSQKTIMAGLNCGTPSIKAWEIIHDLADAFVSIPDCYAEQAIRILSKSGGNLPAIESCESGAAGLAAFIAIQEAPEFNKLKQKLSITENSSFLVINTEGITDPEMYDKIVKYGKE